MKFRTLSVNLYPETGELDDGTYQAWVLTAEVTVYDGPYEPCADLVSVVPDGHDGPGQPFHEWAKAFGISRAQVDDWMVDATVKADSEAARYARGRSAG
jgi:hypothetical protein